MNNKYVNYKGDDMLNMECKHKSVLVKIAMLFQEAGISNNWMVAGGVAQRVNGLTIETQDIDILSDILTAFQIDEVLNEYRIQSMKISGNDRFHSAFGRYEINNIPIEVAGDLKIKGQVNYSLSVTPYVLEHCKKIVLSDYTINIEPLEESLIADLIIERYARVEKIVSVLKSKGINWEYIKERVNASNMPQLLMEKINDALKKF